METNVLVLVIPNAGYQLLVEETVKGIAEFLVIMIVMLIVKMSAEILAVEIVVQNVLLIVMDHV